MTTPRSLARRLRSLLRRERFERDLDEELRFHLEMQTAKNIERGMEPAAARALAEREFGRVERFKDEVRDARGVTWLDDIRRDLRFSVRALRRTPGFVAVVLVCLAVGIGANAAIFSVVNAVLLKPLPYPGADRIVRAYETLNNSGIGSVSFANYRDWAAESRSFQQLAAAQSSAANLQGTTEPERIPATKVTANYFAVFGVPSLLGRTFAAGEDAPGRADVAVMNEGLWRRRFGADSSVVGSSIRLDGTAYTVIGIMPARFSSGTGLWLPLAPTPDQAADRGSHMLSVVGRLRPGVTRESGEAELDRIAHRIARDVPGAEPGRGAALHSFSEDLVGSVRPALLVLLGAVALVLLIACANVANLLLARAAARRHEVAIRLALGASRGRLVRQFLLESLLLAGAGAALGAVLAWVALRALRPFAANALPRASEIALDGHVFLYLLAIALACGVLFGLAPALQSAHGNVRSHLSEAGVKSSGGARQQRLRSSLVVAEIALSLVLLIGAGLLMRGFLMLRGTAPGVDVDHVLTAHLTVPAGEPGDSTAAARFITQVLDRVRTTPGVTAAGMISMLPIQQAWTNLNYSVVGQPKPEPGKEPWAEFRTTTPGTFRALGIPMVAGRDFTLEDRFDSAGTIIINQTLATKAFGATNPIGQQLRLEDGPPSTVIGVVGDVHQAGLDQPPLPEIHMPVGNPYMGREVALVVGTSVPPAGLGRAVRAAVREVNADQPLSQVLTMREIVEQSLLNRRLNLWLLAVFAGVALVLSATGLYGVISYLVSLRTREMGIRMALGARAGDVVGLVLGQGARLTLIGLAIGIAGAFALSRLLASMLYGVSVRDPLTFGAVTVVLTAVALLASLLPARRAARTDPLLAIRSE
jgi:predicted permease